MLCLSSNPKFKHNASKTGFTSFLDVSDREKQIERTTANHWRLSPEVGSIADLQNIVSVVH